MTKKANKKVIKILGVKFTKKKKVKMPKLRFSPDLKPVNRQFEYNKKYKRLAIFASFNKDGLIADYVIYYLQGLKKVVDGIIFVTDNPILPSELDKIKNLVIYAQCERHEEYDFGSYKRGYLWAREKDLIEDLDELVFCNDSCYGPVYPFEQMFEEMHKRKCDFWGISKNIEIFPHIQSYFLVLKSQVFLSTVFLNFFKRIKPEYNVQNVIVEYEVGLCKMLKENSFVGDSYIEYVHNDNSFHKNETLFPVFMMKNKSPLIKVKTMKNCCLNYDGIDNTLNFIREKNFKLFNLVFKK